MTTSTNTLIAGDLSAGHLRSVVRVETGLTTPDGRRPGAVQGFLTEVVHVLDEDDGHPRCRLSFILDRENHAMRVVLQAHHPVVIVQEP